MADTIVICYWDLDFDGWYDNGYSMVFIDCCLSTPPAPNVISACDYTMLATLYAGVRQFSVDMGLHMWDAVYWITQSKDATTQLDLMEPFRETYALNAETKRNPTFLLSQVRALQNHLIIRGGYATVNEYYEQEEILVPQEWADLSALAGYPVDSTYIGGGRL